MSCCLQDNKCSRISPRVRSLSCHGVPTAERGAAGPAGEAPHLYPSVRELVSTATCGCRTHPGTGSVATSCMSHTWASSWTSGGETGGSNSTHGARAAATWPGPGMETWDKARVPTEHSVRSDSGSGPKTPSASNVPLPRPTVEPDPKAPKRPFYLEQCRTEPQPARRWGPSEGRCI